MAINDNYNNNVFMNCPFDTHYLKLRNAMVFAIFDCGFIPRCALEVNDAGVVRFETIKGIIAESKYGIHDISRTELDEVNSLPRFNMPLELGVFIGCARYGRGVQRQKSTLILDEEPYRYQKFISDIAGQDIRAHGNETLRLIGHIRSWLSDQSKRRSIPGGADIAARFARFNLNFPAICTGAKMREDEVTFNDYSQFVFTWLKLESSSVTSASV